MNLEPYYLFLIIIQLSNTCVRKRFSSPCLLKMLYPDYIQHRKPEIHLPYPKCIKSFLFNFYEICESESDPRTGAKCKQCEKSVYMIRGVDVCSSYTFGLVTHLKKHPDQWQEYLDLLKESITPDTKTPRQHYQARTRCNFSTDKEESSRKLKISQTNFNLNKKNCAGVFYTQRDIEILKNQVGYEYQNAKILQYIHSFTNQNLSIFDLIGTKHPGARLDRSYKLTRILVDNDGDIILDLERLLCEHICFFDPEKYDECPNEQDHRGNIAIFSENEYQQKFDGFETEIEKYPEFQFCKSFDYELLENTERIEHDRAAICEMNRLLKILLSLIVVQKKKIDKKVDDLLNTGIDNDNLRKPNLGLQQWGPKVTILDNSSEEDSTTFIPESEFSTFQHIKLSDCPAYTDNSKKASNTPHFVNGKAYYPCNTGSCLKACVCKPCQNPSKYSSSDSFKCSQHSIDHPEMFDDTEDVSISRRQFIDGRTKQPIFKRPELDSFLCPRKIKLAQMKKDCKDCQIVYNDHKKHHHILHEACTICSHLIQSSKISFKVTCYLCFKIFKNKYKLAEHMKTHDPDNAYSCKVCDKSFTNKHNYETHIKTIHSKVRKTFRCDICHDVFSNISNLTRHKMDKHSEEDKEFKCDWCESTFKRKDTLLRHERTIHGKRRTEALIPGVNKRNEPYQCSKCEYAFKDKNTLIRHIESVHQKLSFRCNLCPKVFTRNDKLQTHMKTHGATCPKIICEVCRQEFSSNIELCAHRKETH